MPEQSPFFFVPLSPWTELQLFPLPAIKALMWRASKKASNGNKAKGLLVLLFAAKKFIIIGVVAIGAFFWRIFRRKKAAVCLASGDDATPIRY